jgi:hypothetical protein
MHGLGDRARSGRRGGDNGTEVTTDRFAISLARHTIARGNNCTVNNSTRAARTATGPRSAGMSASSVRWLILETAFSAVTAPPALPEVRPDHRSRQGFGRHSRLRRVTVTPRAQTIQSRKSETWRRAALPTNSRRPSSLSCIRPAAGGTGCAGPPAWNAEKRHLIRHLRLRDLDHRIGRSSDPVFGLDTVAVFRQRGQGIHHQKCTPM